MKNDFINITIIFCIWLISIDMAFLAIRRKRFAQGKSLKFDLQKISQPARIWIESKVSKLQKLRSLLFPDRNLSDTQNTTPDSLEGQAPAYSVLPANGASIENNDAIRLMTAKPLSVEATLAAPISPENETTSITQNQSSKNINSSASNNTVHLKISADIPEGSIIYLTVEVANKQGKFTIQESKISPVSEDKPLFPTHQKRIPINMGQIVSKIRQRLISLALILNAKIENLDRALLVTTIAMYAVVVSIGIDRYPIYFFTDEAAHMNLASDFIRDGFKNYFGEFMPTFFSTEGWVNGTSVYVQVLPLLIFGKSVIVTRLVSALISLLGALAIGLLLKDVFKLKYYWAGAFLLLTTPAWFLHARTAFEYVEVAAFYSIFLYFYGRYRVGHLQSLYWAIIAGALAFYTHGLGQILMGITGLALLIVDFRYHIHPDRRRTVLTGLLLGIILLLPFARYYLAHPAEAAEQVKRRGSYWVDNNLTFSQKMGDFLRQYIYGLSPSYWYFQNPVDLNRHIMYRYGNALWYTLPLILVGLFQIVKNICQPAYRMVLIALLASPVPASVVAIGMPRMLFMTIPLALIGIIGLVPILDWAQKRWRIPTRWIASGTFLLLAGVSLFMLRDALINGPTWFQDYTLYGMQYGAKQVFQDVVRTGLEKDPNRQYIVSPSWANGTEQFVAFFIPNNLRANISLGQPVNFIDRLKKNPTNLYFVATSAEYDNLVANPEFTDIKVIQVLPYPNGKPGFYVITLKVASNIDQILAAQQEKERKLVEDVMTINEQTVRIVHSPFGSGRIQDIFDNNPDTLARVLRANPEIFDIYPTSPITTNNVTIQTGSLPDFTVNVSLYAPNTTEPVIYSQTFKGLPPDPLVTIPFDKGPAKSSRIYIEIKDNTSGETSQIHVRTIQFK